MQDRFGNPNRGRSHNADMARAHGYAPYAGDTCTAESNEADELKAHGYAPYAGDTCTTTTEAGELKARGAQLRRLAMTLHDQESHARSMASKYAEASNANHRAADACFLAANALGVLPDYTT